MFRLVDDLIEHFFGLLLTSSMKTVQFKRSASNNDLTNLTTRPIINYFYFLSQRGTRAVFVKFHWGGVEVLAIEVDDRANA